MNVNTLPDFPSSTETQDDAELVILESIYASQKTPRVLKQRDLANAAGASLGMTNAILKRLAHKGLIIILRVNSRNIQYAVTPDGINEIARRSYRFFKRTIKNVVFYRDRIDEAIAQAKLRGVQAVLLIGVSDLDFIVEHSCDRHGLPFLKAVDADVAAAALGAMVFPVFSESTLPKEQTSDEEALYLSSILSGRENG